MTVKTTSAGVASGYTDRVTLIVTGQTPTSVKRLFDLKLAVQFAVYTLVAGATIVMKVLGIVSTIV